MDNDFKKEFWFVAVVCMIAVLAGVAGYFCMTPEQRAAEKERQRIEMEQQKHQEDESVLSPTMKLILFKTIW
jgi:hypothetical protein